MKTLRYLAGTLALTAVSTSFAAQEKTAPPSEIAAKTNPAEWAALFGGAPLPTVWQSARAAVEKIATALAAQDLFVVPPLAETAHLAAHALLDQVKLDDPERQKRLHATLAHAAQLADEVMAAARHNDSAKLGDAFPRLQAALQLAARRLPKEIVTAPPQAVRVAPKK